MNHDANMNLLPTGLRIESEFKLVIDWNDGGQQTVEVKELRARCPCSVCRKKSETGQKAQQPASPFTVLSDAEIRPLRIEGMKPIGNYGYSIAFTDGHATGIYAFEYLRTLGELRPRSV